MNAPVAQHPVFKWKPGCRFKSADPEIVGRHLEMLRARHGGMLTAAIMRDDARSKGSPLHDLFDWNDSTAAEQHRLDTARKIIGSLIQIQVETDDPVRYYARVVIEDEDEDEEREEGEESEKKIGYIGMREAMSRVDLREQVLATALSELAAFERKYKHLSELAEVFGALRRMKRLVAKKRPKKRK